MTERPSYRSPELLRLSACCRTQIGVANAKWWCAGCGQQVLRPSDVFHSFSSHPAPAAPAVTPSTARGRRRGVSPDQGAFL